VVSAQKLVDAWYGKGAANLRDRSIPVPKFSRETGEAILAHLLVSGYLQEDFHFTPYSTISYLKRGMNDMYSKTLLHQTLRGKEYFKLVKSLSYRL
jgi:ATP-dependent DNA helicase Q1